MVTYSQFTILLRFAFLLLYCFVPQVPRQECMNVPKQVSMCKWTFITENSEDPRYCDDHPDCERGEDEPPSCYDHAYVVTGSKDMDGVYKHSSGVNSKRDVYQEGNRFLWKNKASRWVLSRGPSKEEAHAHYKSGTFL